MKKFGYARVSSTDQDLTLQQTALAHCDVIFAEKVSGTNLDGRDELKKLLGLLREGDTLVVVRLDRLGRSLRDLLNIVHEIEGAGAHLHVLEQELNTSTPAGRALFGMLGVFAQFETDVRRERQMEGIARAKALGKYKGTVGRIDPDRVRALLDEGLGPAAVGRELGIARSSVYRLMNGRSDDER